MIQAIGLTSQSDRGLPPAVDDVSFEAPPGRVTVLHGARGAGKSTALRLMLEMEPGRGVTLFRGRPLHRVPNPAREVGVLLGDVPGHPARTARTHLRMLTAAAGVPAERAEDVLDVVGLSGLADHRLGGFSRGMDRRLGLAAALLGDPHTLVLDEPAEGLSPREAAWLRGLLRRYAEQGGAVLVALQDVKETARLADRVVVLQEGRLTADQDAAEFARTRLRPRVTVRSPQADRLADLLVDESQRALPGSTPTEVVRENGTTIAVYGSSCAVIGEVAFRHGILVHRLSEESGHAAPVRPLSRADGRPSTAGPATAEGDRRPGLATSRAHGAPARCGISTGSLGTPVAAALRRVMHEVPAGGTRREATPEESPASAEDRVVMAGARTAHAGADDDGLTVRRSLRTAGAAEERETAPAGGSAAEVTATVVSAAERLRPATRVGLTRVPPDARHPLPSPSGSGQAGAGETDGPSAAVGAETAEEAASSGPRLPPPTPTSVFRPLHSDLTAGSLPAASSRGTGAGAGTEAGRVTALTGRLSVAAPDRSAETASGQTAAKDGSRTGAESGEGPGPDAEGTPGRPGSSGPGLKDLLTGRGSAENRSATPPATQTGLPEESPGRLPTDAVHVTVEAGRGDTATHDEAELPQAVIRRTAPGPAWPVRYEMRRVTSDRPTAAVLLLSVAVSVAIAVWWARTGETPAPRTLAGWPGVLPLPVAAVGAGLVGALAYGQEYRYPALAPARGTVPHRLRLLLAKLGVSAGAALLLAAVVLAADSAAIRLLWGTAAASPPADRALFAGGWAVLMVACAWTGALAAAVFRSTTVGLAAVVAVPVLVGNLLRLVLDEPAVRMMTGLRARLESTAEQLWPALREPLDVLLRLVGQPVGGAMALSLLALLCAFAATGLRRRAR
ncbi:ATP-binding cassette domain-containing protein [Streptomyces sp. NPDC059740]|uniref:ATP-binding cassette domain-containing protein n=1 Tax=Streptomyces sp. NPDC059740 TaxID=3346926 RepID=UPI0036596DF0